MEQPIIQDDSVEAKWFVNTGNYAFMDYTTGVRFDPRTPVRTKLTPWMESQPTIVAYRFPEEDEAEAAAKAEAEAAEAAAEEAAAKAEEAAAVKTKK